MKQIRNLSGRGLSKVIIMFGVIITTLTAVAERPPIGQLFGAVTDLEGRPLRDVEFSAMPIHVNSHPAPVSNSDGVFSFQYRVNQWEREQGDFVLIVRHKERNLAKAINFTEDTEQLDIQLEPGVKVTGQVVDPQGRPIENASMSTTIWHGSHGRTNNYDTSTPDGRFVISALPAEDTRLSISIHGEQHGIFRTYLDMSEVVDSVLDLGTIELSAAEMSISGTVVDIDDNPLMNVRISASGQNQPSRVTQSYPEGSFTVENLVEGQVNLNFSLQQHNRNMHKHMQLESGQTDVKIVMMPPDSRRPAAAEPQIESLQGKVCPDMSELGVEAEIEGRALAVCFVDVGQRVNRRFLSELADVYSSANDSTQIIVVQIEPIDEDMFSQLAGGYPFEIALPAVDNYAELRAKWGVTALPWAILADSERIVLEEGISIQSLQQVINK